MVPAGPNNSFFFKLEASQNFVEKGENCKQKEWSQQNAFQLTEKRSKLQKDYVKNFKTILLMLRG